MKLSILLRPRNNNNVKLFEALKNTLKKTEKKDLKSTIQNVLEEYSLINNSGYFFHVNKFNIVVLDSDSNEIIIFGTNEE